MIHNVVTEALVITVIFGTVAVYYFIAFNGQFNSVSWLYLIAAALYVLYYYHKWKLLHNMQCVACRVKSNFQRQVETLERYIRFYLVAGTALVPVLFILLGVLFYVKFPAGSFWFFFPPLHHSPGPALLAWLIWGLLLLTVTTATWMGNRWFIRRLYGRHIGKLKQLLDQMEEE
jgi:hypothetical protein